MVFLEIAIVSHFKIESAFLELLVFVRVEAEQLRWPMTTGHLGLLQRHQQAKAQDLFAEVPLVQFISEHRFVEMLELRKRELGRQQLEPDRLVSPLAPNRRGS